MCGSLKTGLTLIINGFNKFRICRSGIYARRFLNPPMFVGHQCPTYGLSDDLSGSLKLKPHLRPQLPLINHHSRRERHGGKPRQQRKIGHDAVQTAAVEQQRLKRF